MIRYYEIIGVTAAILTTFGFVPQIFKMYKSKSSHDISIITLIQFSAGTGLWTLYGFYINDIIIIGANIISFLTIMISIIFYSRYKNKIEKRIEKKEGKIK